MQEAKKKDASVVAKLSGVVVVEEAMAPEAPAEQVNYVKRLYDRYTDEQISKKIGDLVYPKDTAWHGDLDIVFLPVDKMRAALPNNNGDWYFTGNYPTPGGYSTLNKAFINYYEDKDGRAY